MFDHILEAAPLSYILLRIFGRVIAESGNFLWRSNFDEDYVIQVGVELDTHLILGSPDHMDDLCAESCVTRFTHKGPSLRTALERFKHAADSVVPGPRLPLPIFELWLKQFHAVEVQRILINLNVPLIQNLVVGKSRNERLNFTQSRIGVRNFIILNFYLVLEVFGEILWE